MLQYVSDGGEMLAGDDRNKELGLQSSEVVITCTFFDHIVSIVTQIYIPP